MKQRKTFLGIIILALLLVGILILTGGEKNEDKNPSTGNLILDNPELAGDPDKLTLYFFWGEGCPHCADQKKYLDEWEQKYPDKLEIKRFEIYKNSKNANLFQKVAPVYGIQARGVPTTFIAENYWVGFSDSMAPEIENYIEECIENKCENKLK